MEAVQSTLKEIGIGNEFLNRTQMIIHLREIMNKRDGIK
jgi:hypothetical protein